MDKYYLIYKTTNNLNNMIYVGCHITENKDDDYLGSGKYFTHAVTKYGRDRFSKEILLECSSREEMLDKEREIVDEAFIARLDTYNITIGGYGGFYYIKEHGLNHSVDQHKIAAEKIKSDPEYSKWFSEKVSIGMKAYYENNPGSWVGKKHNDESKKKIGKANSVHQLGEGNSQYGTMWITNGLENIKIKKNEELPRGFRKGRKIKHI